MNSTTELKPNDVAVILRPNIADGKWTGSFDIMVSGIGPITLTNIEMDQLIGMGVLLVSVVSLMEHDKEIACQIIDYCNKNYSDVGEFETAEEELEVVTSLSVNTRCVGGVQ
jgi:hypothetical protein